MTSNIGSQAIIDLTNEDADSKEMHNRCMDSLQAHFLPEFLNRIDEVIVFKPLGREEIREIVDLQMKQLNNQLADNGFTLEITDAAKDLLASEGYDQKYGARPLKRVIQQRLQNSLANEILAGNFAEGSTIQVDAVEGRFVFAAT